MFVVKAEGLAKEYHGQQLFHQVDLEIREGEIVALIGANGAGKTTLLRGLTGRIPMDRGRIHRRLPVDAWGLLEQQPDVPGEMTVLDFIRAGFPDLARARAELFRWEQEMMKSADADPEAVQRYGAALDRYQSLGGYEWEAMVERTAVQLGLGAEQWSIPFDRLSGGQKTRAQLARLMVGNPSFLLLDEPTNHLDDETLTWLEQWLLTYKGAVLLVSHDRWLIDRVAHATVELTAEGTKRYPGGYSAFAWERDRERRTQEALYKKQEQERKRLEEAIRRYRQWFDRAHSAAGERNPFLKKKANKNRSRFKAKEEALERLEKQKVERPREEKKIRVRFEEGTFEARNLIQTENLGFGYGESPLFEEVNLTLSRGDRLAVIGPNGSGKTTLIRLLTGQLSPDEGKVRRHPALSIGYFAQELNELHAGDTVLDTLLRLPGMDRAEARNILASFLFPGNEVFRKISELSMGERCRVAFVTLYFSRAHLMVLDEPTNYLDIPARERIEEALAGYPGSLVLVSHDRYLLRKIANRVAVIEEGRVHLYPGSYAEYLERRESSETIPENPDIANRIRALELQLARLMGEEEPEEEEEKERMQAEIRRLQSELDRLKEEG
ncbi:ribosomal protection-like ABC-F family protein [Paludifilum halophilum]|uniref:ABC transporter ATP-binding protein n=1 Tax=Paludifilum halophilum TaxID=1642702 RepID=A0A235B4A6_9BACL|nr:ABC-F type ribosomal protection protein [Paludifilum halophilum]OYD07113.1 ABC transporter ATP-binding protein [Paludifilum halophilum]